MKQQLKSIVKPSLMKLVPDAFKEFLFRGAFFMMSESMKNKLRKDFNMLSMEASIENLQKLGFTPLKIVDIGAYQGEWTKMIKQIFPNAYVLMIEAQPKKEAELKLVQKLYSGSVDYVVSLLGSQERDDIKFYEMETGSSVLEELTNEHRTVVNMPMKTLDNLLLEKEIEDISFLKLDVQGYEIEVLKGAQKTLKNLEVVLMEVSVQQYNKDAPVFDEVINYMKSIGFLAFDICSAMRRNLEIQILQVDIIFVRKESYLNRNKIIN